MQHRDQLNKPMKRFVPQKGLEKKTVAFLKMQHQMMLKTRKSDITLFPLIMSLLTDAGVKRTTLGQWHGFQMKAGNYKQSINVIYLNLFYITLRCADLCATALLLL